VEVRVGRGDRQRVSPGDRSLDRAGGTLQLLHLRGLYPGRGEPRDGLDDDELELEEMAGLQEVEGPDDDPGVAVDVDEALRAEEEDRLPDRRSTESELCRELDVVETLTGTELERDDASLDLVVGLLHQEAALTRHGLPPEYPPGRGC